jgi:hypothetical protein
VRAVIDPTTPETLGEGIYFDPSLSYDATRLLFCFKGRPTGTPRSTKSGWTARGCGGSPITARRAGNPYKGTGGGHHDVKPCYLPDGRIVFTSTALQRTGALRQQRRGDPACHERRRQRYPLHLGEQRHRVQSGVLPDGRILFGRWEYVDRNALVIQSLWTMLPDGRNETELYANNMVFPEAILQAKPVPGHPGWWWPPSRRTTRRRAGRLPCGHARAARTIPRRSSTSSGRTGRSTIAVNRATPGRCRRILWCTAAARRSPAAPPRNALMLIDRAGRRVTVHVDPAIDLHHPIPLTPRPLPAVSLAVTDRTQPTGRFFVQDVYASMPEVKRGTVRWLRVVEETSRVSASPGQNVDEPDSSRSRPRWPGARRSIHGVVPVEPDGSVFFEAPSGRALYFQLLDGDHRLVRGMRTFIQAAPGVTRSCTGCHEYNPAPAESDAPGGRTAPPAPGIVGRRPC